MASVRLASPCVNPNLPTTFFSFENNSSNPRDASFTSYFIATKETFSSEIGNHARNPSSVQISLGKKKTHDGEIDIFGAERYFNGGMDGESELITERSLKQTPKKDGKYSAKTRSGTGSTCSEASGNSQNTLLRDRRRDSHSNGQKQANGKRFLGVFRCSCSRKSSVEVDKDVVENMSSSNCKKTAGFSECDDRSPVSWSGNKQIGGEFWYNEEMGSRRIDKISIGLKKEENLTFPNSNPVVGNSTVGRELHEEEKARISLGVFGSPFLEKEDLGTSLRRSLTLLTPIASGRSAPRDDDLGSESSSDLFEIESLSVKAHPFFRPEVTDGVVTCYEPSEASIEWSVVTASAANFSVASESNDPSTRVNETKKPSKHHRPSLLLGCVSGKALDVTANAHKMPEKTSSDRWRMENSVYHAESCRVMDLESARAGHAVAACSLSRSRASRDSRPLYMH